MRRGSGSTCTGAAGDAIRQRTEDSGLLASELPGVKIAFARRRLATIHERASASASRIGFGLRGSE